MLNLSNLLTSDLLPGWITNSFPVIRVIIITVLALCAVVLIITVLMQSSTSGGGTNAISGVQESYYAQNKGGNKEGRLKKITITATSIIAFCSVIYFIMELIYKGY